MEALLEPAALDLTTDLAEHRTASDPNEMDVAVEKRECLDRIQRRLLEVQATDGACDPCVLWNTQKASRLGT